MVYITRVERFNSAHKLWVEEWSDEENVAIFGKCSNKNWHGHNYYLHVTVKGKPHPITGFVMDAKKLGDIVKQHVTEKLDHRNINLDVPDFPKMQPTAENIAMYIWSQIEPHLTDTGATLHRIKLYETETIYAEYYGE
jgi:6-pyruvoyltetrahydropterin/6-carboxytetrahydropterin synthase